MDTKHTPGPWAVEYIGDKLASETMSDATVCIVGDYRIVVKDQPSYEFHGNDEDDARLIAAAPDLLAALQTCLTAEEERRATLKPGAPATTYTENRIELIRAAIAKAEGRS